MRHLQPVGSSERIESMDVLRGFAVLGILAMNVGAFSMPAAAYFNPSVYGDLGGLNGWVWRLTHLLADLKFMAIFAMLFGAGIVLMWQRAEERSRPSTGLHYRRMFWLILFGLLHAHLLWYGDILYWYGMTGLLVYLLRKRSPAALIVIAVLFFAVSSSLMIFSGLSMDQWPPEERADMIEQLNPSDAAKADEIAAYRGSWLEQMEPRREHAIEMETSTYLAWAIWRVGGLMLLGMALFKLGVLSAARSRSFYLGLVGLAVLVGLPLVGYGMQRNIASGWPTPEFFFLGTQYNYWGSVLVALGWIGAVMLLCQQSVAMITGRLAAVGRMAFTNYIMQTVICTTVFYGHGFGLFGSMERVGQFAVVVGVWIFQLIVSPIWLRHFRYGPLEWLWRSLVYLEVQPFRQHAD